MELRSSAWLVKAALIREIIMARARFGVLLAFCVGSLFFSSSALAQAAAPAPRTPDNTLPSDIIGGSIYSPDGVTHIVGDGMGGGFILGPSGVSTFISNGAGGGTLYAPDSTGAIISDGRGGGILYSPQKNKRHVVQGTTNNSIKSSAASVSIAMASLCLALGIGLFLGRRAWVPKVRGYFSGA
jgi:hypothetical protein